MSGDIWLHFSVCGFKEWTALLFALPYHLPPGEKMIDACTSNHNNELSGYGFDSEKRNKMPKLDTCRCCNNYWGKKLSKHWQTVLKVMINSYPQGRDTFSKEEWMKITNPLRYRIVNLLKMKKYNSMSLRWFWKLFVQLPSKAHFSSWTHAKTLQDKLQIWGQFFSWWRSAQVQEEFHGRVSFLGVWNPVVEEDGIREPQALQGDIIDGVIAIQVIAIDFLSGVPPCAVLQWSLLLLQ